MDCMMSWDTSRRVRPGLMMCMQAAMAFSWASDALRMAASSSGLLTARARLSGSFRSTYTAPGSAASR